MACINPDGTLTKTARALLHTLRTYLTAEEMSKQTREPLFRVRGSLREMVNAKLIHNQEDKYIITETGKEALTLGS